MKNLKEMFVHCAKNAAVEGTSALILGAKAAAAGVAFIGYGAGTIALALPAGVYSGAQTLAGKARRVRAKFAAKAEAQATAKAAAAAQPLDPQSVVVTQATYDVGKDVTTTAQAVASPEGDMQVPPMAVPA